MPFKSFADFLDALRNYFLTQDNRPWNLMILGGLAMLLVLLILWRFLRKRRQAIKPLAAELRIELAKLINDGPPPGMPVLEFYNLPMRLAGIVLAPVGRMRELPPPGELPAVFESVLPGLEGVVNLHRPLVRCWPNQVSTRGFAHAFFGNIRLPGTAGKGTPWSAAAGMVKHRGVPIMIGLVLLRRFANSLGQIVINAEHEWLGCLRVKQ